MDNERLNTEETIFSAAVQLPTPAEREAYLDEACGGDQDLRRRVEELLEAVPEVSRFMEAPPPGSEAFSGLSEGAVQPAEPIGTCIDRYKLRERIGEGGCGVVYVAEQEVPVRRLVALKIIKLGMDTRQVVARFEAERQALAVMDHPNIAKVLDAGTTLTGRPYFVMELVRGLRITEFCDQGRLDTAQRLKLFIQVCQAIQHAHQKGIIHRDLKPSNILVTIQDGEPVPKVIDFGIAKAIEGRLTDKTIYTELHQFIGTPAYMSPEQALLTSVDIDTRSDIYSLGVLLYELLTGSTPFDSKALLARGLDEMRHNIREVEPPRPSTRLNHLRKPDLDTAAHLRACEGFKLVSQIRGDLDWIVMKALEKDRSRRYETATGLANDLKCFLANEPIQARPPGTWYRFGKLVQRHRAMVAGATFVLLVLIAAVIASTTLLLREQQARARADNAESAKALALQKMIAAQSLLEQNLYVADMRQAQLLIDQNDLGHALDVLNRYPPKAGETVDLRGFEWRYLWQRCQGDPHEILPRVKGMPWWMEFSPDGKHLAVAAGAGLSASVTVFDFQKKEVVTTLEADRTADGDPACAVFSGDGKMLVTACHDRVKFFEVNGWKERPALSLTNVAGPIALHGNTLVTMPTQQLRDDKHWKDIRIWDLATKEARVLHRVDGPPVLSPDGKRLITDSPDGLKVWSLEDLAKAPLLLAGSRDLLSHISGYQALRKSVAFSPDGRLVAAAGHSGEIPIMIWDAAHGTRLDQDRLTGHQSHISALVWLPDSESVATCSADRTIRIWDLTQWREKRKLVGHLGEPWAIACEPQGGSLVSGSIDSQADHLKIWPIRSQETPRDAADDWYPIWVSSNGRRFVVVTLAAGVKYWDRTDGRLLASVPAPDGFHVEMVSVVGFSGDTESPRWGFAGLTNGWVASYPFGPTRFPRLRQCHASKVTGVVCGPQGKELITSGEDGQIRWWDLSSGDSIRSIAGLGKVTALALDPQAKTLVSASAGSSNETLLCWWEAASAQLVSSNKLSRWVDQIDFSPDGKTLAARSLDEDETLLVDAATKRVLTLPARGRNAVFSSDSTKFLTSGSGVRLWNVRDASPFGGALKGNRQMVLQLTFSPDSKTVVSTCDDGTIRLWNVTMQKEVLTLFEKGRVPGYPMFSADGTTLVVGSFMADRGPVRFWSAPTFAEIAEIKRTAKDNH